MDISDLKKKYRGKSVLVTGAGGFIGSHLAETLVRLGATVTAFVHYNSNGKRGWLDKSTLLSEMEVVFGDIRDTFQCRSIVRGKDIIFNLAALIGIPYSYLAPLSYFDTNLHGIINILEAVKDQGDSRVVQMSTSEVYGSAQTIPMTEAHIYQPQSPYSASKIAADSVAMSYYFFFGV